MKILAVIPARYQSQRFPGKPLAQLGDRPLIQWVYQGTQKCPAFTQVIVATDHQEIATCVRKFGGQVEITSSEHLSGTDRVAEVAQRYPQMEVIVNVQGDQPFVTVQMLQELVFPYQQGETPGMTTLACPLKDESSYTDSNIVKVLCDRHQNALYFSRAPIPYYRNLKTAPVYHHLGLYAFRRDFLLTYSQLSPTPLEQCEALEQLRVLEHGYKIRVCQTENATIEVNTPEDLEKAHSILEKSAKS